MPTGELTSDEKRWLVKFVRDNPRRTYDEVCSVMTLRLGRPVTAAMVYAAHVEALFDVIP